MKKLMALVLFALISVACLGAPSEGEFYETYMNSRTARVPPEPGRTPAQLVDFRLDHLQDANRSGTDTNTYHYGSFVTDFDHDYYLPESRNFRTLQHFIDWLDWRLSFYPPLDEHTLGDRWKWLFQPYPNDYEQSALGVFDWIDNDGPYVRGTNILAGRNGTNFIAHADSPTNHEWGPYLYGRGILGGTPDGVVSNTMPDGSDMYGPFLMGTNILGGEYDNGQWVVAAGLYPDTVTELKFDSAGVADQSDFTTNNPAFRYVFRGAVWYEGGAGAENAFSYDLVVQNTTTLTNSETGESLDSWNGIFGPGAQGWLQQPVVFRGLRHYSGAYSGGSGNTISISRTDFDRVASSYATLCLKAGGHYGVYTVVGVALGDSSVTLTLDRNLEVAVSGTFYLCGDVGQFGLPVGPNKFNIVTSKSGLTKTNFKGFVRATSRKNAPWVAE